MSGAIPPIPKYAFMERCPVIKKHRDNFTSFYIVNREGLNI
jgi:hypothetical protein